MESKKSVFVVHGRNTKIRRSMFSFLRSIGLEPIEWEKAKLLTDKSNPYIGEILEAAFSKAQAILVLFTPDDEAKLKAQYIIPTDGIHEKALTSQARPNVIFEAGMALGYCEDRTILVEIGNLRPFSDLAGRHTIRFSDDPESRMRLIEALRAVGLDVDIDGKLDYLSEGDFEVSDNSTTVKYNANGGSGAPASHRVINDSNGVAGYTLSETIPIKNGYTFLGWRLENSTAYGIDSPRQSIAINTGNAASNTTFTYYAQWKAIDT